MLVVVLASCQLERARVGGEGPEGAPPMGDSPEEGRLSARPGQAGPGTATSTGVQRLDLGEGGTALVFVPAGHRPEQPSPLAVMFHGAGGTAEAGLGLLQRFADDTGMLLVAPQSRGRTWDLLLEGYGPDVALVDEALDQVFGGHAVDPARVAVGGFSDGASYALSLGTLNGDLFTHVIAFSPGFWARGAAEGSPQIFITHGTGDPVLPIDSTSRRLVPMLEQAGYQVSYHEFTGGHVVPDDLAADAVAWFLDAP